MELVFATNNLNKLSEIKNLLPSIDILGLKDIGCHEDIPETSDTLVGNAFIKANHVFEKYGYNCFSDDTGLEIEALNGEPGVYSARYAGIDCNAEDNMKLVLDKMKGQINRNARFVTVIALIIDGVKHHFTGTVEGNILLHRQGEKGFGYDPIFQPKGFEQSFAEMTQEEKGRISHRGRAVRQLIDFLKEG